MRPDEGAGNRQAETDTSGSPVAGSLQADKWLEYALDLALRHAGTVILDDDLDVLAIPFERDAAAAAVGDRILDEISHPPTQARGTARVRKLFRRSEDDRRITQFSNVVAHALHE
jgi:hypothetical protein